MKRILSQLVLGWMIVLAGCSTAPSSPSARSSLQNEAQATIAEFRSDDPEIVRFFDTSVGYAVFPSIGKGGLVLGGAYGRGVLHERGQFTAYCDMKQGTVGAQIGGQKYSEVIFFETQKALDDFKNGSFELSAQATAVALKSGAAKTAKYDRGVAIFVGGQGGLMAEASVGGQKFKVVGANEVDLARYDQQNQSNVYGYAGNNDLLDPNWRADSPYNRLYDTNRVRTIQGRVTAASEYSPASNAPKGRQLTVHTSDDQTYIVHLGPIAYSPVNTWQVREGDHVTVIGATTAFNGNDVIIAREVRSSDNRLLELRDTQGRPMWDMRR